MIELPLETWVLLSAIVGFGICVIAAFRSEIRRSRDDLGADFARLEAKIASISAEISRRP